MEYIYIDLFIYLLLLSFTIRTVRNVFYYTFLWQLKEYRIDRLLSHLTTDQGKKLILGPITLFKWVLLALIIGGLLSIDFSFLGLLSFFAFGFIWIAETAKYLRELIIKGWRVPKLTIKIIAIFAAVFFFQFIPLINGDLIEQLSFGPFLDKLLAPTIFFIVMIANIPSFIFRKIIVTLATRKISRFKNLEVIGITGSYGKTSTKEFLAQILSTKFKVLRTQGYINTEVGIAQTILRNLSYNYNVFIAEMGAYKKGEIEAICRIIKPQIGIITGINQQHLQLFGSIEKTVETKFELIKNLIPSGMAAFNADNKWTRKMISWTKRERPDLTVVTYGEQKADLVVKDIKVEEESIHFDMYYGKQKESFELGLSGEQNVNNFLGATLVALKSGFTLSEVRKIAGKIVSPPKTMKRIVGIKKSTFIDDTFNSNPDGVIATLNYMRVFKGKKILVLTPLIELGKEAQEIHKVLGEKAAEVCDLILLTNLNYNRFFIEGADRKTKGGKKVQIVNVPVGVKLIKQNLNPDAVVVFEGKEAGRILESLVISH